jgi:hypothetical protein
MVISSEIPLEQVGELIKNQLESANKILNLIFVDIHPKLNNLKISFGWQKSIEKNKDELITISRYLATNLPKYDKNSFIERSNDRIIRMINAYTNIMLDLSNYLSKITSNLDFIYYGVRTVAKKEKALITALNKVLTQIKEFDAENKKILSLLGKSKAEILKSIEILNIWNFEPFFLELFEKDETIVLNLKDSPYAKSYNFLGKISLNVKFLKLMNLFYYNLFGRIIKKKNKTTELVNCLDFIARILNQKKQLKTSISNYISASFEYLIHNHPLFFNYLSKDTSSLTIDVYFFTYLGDLQLYARKKDNFAKALLNQKIYTRIYININFILEQISNQAYHLLAIDLAHELQHLEDPLAIKKNRNLCIRIRLEGLAEFKSFITRPAISLENLNLDYFNQIMETPLNYVQIEYLYLYSPLIAMELGLYMTIIIFLGELKKEKRIDITLGDKLKIANIVRSEYYDFALEILKNLKDKDHKNFFNNYLDCCNVLKIRLIFQKDVFNKL